MRSVHLVIPDLFLPEDFAAEAGAGLSVPALEKMLGRGHSEILDPVPLENLLCELFGVPCAADAPIAPISAAFDGLAAGCWLRADPVHLRLQRDQMLLLPVVEISAGEAGEMCASLNGHFAGQGMEFFAPHSHRWYVRLDSLPRIRTTPLSQVVGGDVRAVCQAAKMQRTGTGCSMRSRCCCMRIRSTRPAKRAASRLSTACGFGGVAVARAWYFRKTMTV